MNSGDNRLTHQDKVAPSPRDAETADTDDLAGSNQPTDRKERAPSGHGSRFDRKLDEAVIAVLTHRTMEEAARATDISPASLYRWRKEPKFQARYEEMRNAVFDHATARAQYASDAAVSTKLKIMITSPSEACRLRAAEKLWSIAERASMREGARREPSQGRANPKDDVPVNLAERIIAARMRLREEQERRRKEQNRKTGAEQGDV